MTRRKVPVLTFDARTFARAWLATTIAASPDSSRPTLHNSACLEGFDDGVGLISTDSYMLARSFASFAGEPLRWRSLPSKDIEPLWTMTPSDEHGRLRSLLSWATVRRGTPNAELTVSRTDDGFVDFDYDGIERVTVPDRGKFVDWRLLVVAPREASTSRIGLGIGKIRQLGRFERHFGPNAVVRIKWTDQLKPVHFSMRSAGSPALDGLLMPVRIDENEWSDDQ